MSDPEPKFLLTVDANEENGEHAMAGNSPRVCPYITAEYSKSIIESTPKN